MEPHGLTVPAPVREALRQRHPGLDRNPAYYRLTGYLIAPTQIDGTSGSPVISAPTLAAIEGKEREARGGHYRAARFLQAVTADALPELRCSHWSYRDQKARVALDDGLDPTIKVSVRDALDVLPWDRPQRVHLDSGKAVHPRDAPARRRDLLARHTNIAARTRGCWPILDYQNNMTATAYARKVRENASAARAHLDASPPGPSTQQARNAFARVLEDPVPLLKAVANSDRAFSIGSSLITIRSDLRRILTQGWYEYDLRQAQLATITALWNVEGIEPLLDADTSTWSLIASDLGLPLQPFKRAIKAAIYTLTFGGSERRIKTDLAASIRESMTPMPPVLVPTDAAAFLNAATRAAGTGIHATSPGRANGSPHRIEVLAPLDPEAISDKFLRLPLVRHLMKARDARMVQIRRSGGLVTCFGRPIDIRKGVKDKGDIHERVRSALAQEAQALETALILPIYALARTTKQFKVMLYSFDGVTVSYRDKRTVGEWEARIQDAVAIEARARGVRTRLNPA